MQEFIVKSSRKMDHEVIRNKVVSRLQELGLNNVTPTNDNVIGDLLCVNNNFSRV